MKFNLRAKNRGIALMMVLIVVMVFSAMAGLFAYSMKVETKLARNATFDADFEWAARSGVEVARWVLANDSAGPFGQIDSKLSKWAGGPGDTNGPLAELDLSNIELGNGKLSIKIEDNDSKFNINVADDIILRQALTKIGVDASEVPTIADSILDWRDPDNRRHPNGAESDVYKTRNPPYFAKDAPIDDLSELRLVDGVTKNMYYGSHGGGSWRQVLNRPVNAQSALEEPSYVIGFVDLFSALSGRLVNINTAKPEALQIFPEIDENIAQAIVQARAGQDGSEGTEDDMPFRSPQEIARVPGINPVAVASLGRFFTVRSLVFEATVTSTIGGQTRTCVAMLRRNGPADVQVLSFWWK